MFGRRSARVKGWSGWRLPMSTPAHPAPHRVHWPHRWVVWSLVGLVAAAGIGAGIDRAFFSGQPQYSWPPEPCMVEGLDARCGTFVVPENRAKPNGRTIGLHVVVLPAFVEARPRGRGHVSRRRTGKRRDRAGGRPELEQLSALNVYRDILLVDQRGTGRSNPHGGDATQYGTRMAMDDLDAVRAALGYRQLDVIGSSYGATAAQVYLKLHPSSVRTLILSGATAIDVPFFGRYAVNAQRALDQLAKLCASDPACRKAFPGWERQFGELVKAWNAHPTHGMTGDELASIVHVCCSIWTKAVSIPLVVSRAARGDYAPLEHAGPGRSRRRPQAHVLVDLVQRALGRARREGPWGTDFDSYTTAQIAAFRHQCSSVPKRAEPRVALDAPRFQPRAGTRPRGRRRPAGSGHEPL